MDEDILEPDIEINCLDCHVSYLVGFWDSFDELTCAYCGSDKFYASEC